MQVFKAFLKSARKYLPINLMYFVIFCTCFIPDSRAGYRDY